MTDILVQPPELRRIAGQLRTSASKIGAALQTIDKNIQSIKGDNFLGNRASAMQAHYAQKRDALLKAQNLITHFASELGDAADVFEKADKSGVGGAGSTTGGFLDYIGKTIDNGIHFLFKTGMDFVEGAENVAKKAISVSDHAIDSAFGLLLPHMFKGSTDTIEIQLKGDITIPGAEVGVPGSFKVIKGQTVSIAHNPDGTYTVVLKGEAGAGINEPLVEAKAKLRVGDKTYGAGVDVSGEALGVGQTEVFFQFDPKRAGDMTKMAAFLGAQGIINTPGNEVMVAPTLLALKDNIVGMKAGAGVQAGGSADVKALVKVAGVDVSGQLTSGQSLQKTPQGWESSQYIELQGEGKANLLTMEGGLKVNTSLESVHNLQTNLDSARVTVTLTGEAGRKIDLQDLNKYLPQSDLSSIKVSEQLGGSVTIEYTLDRPVETVKNTLVPPEGGPPNFSAIAENSHIEVSGNTFVETGLGGEVKGGAITQGIGGSIDGTVSRQTGGVIYQYEPQQAT